MMTNNLREASGRVCSACGKFKLFAELRKNKTCAYGYQALCKECDRAGSSKRYVANWESYITKRSEYRQTERGKAVKIAEAKRQIIKYPEKQKARREVAKALKNGTLTKPVACDGCDRMTKLQAHHPDYSKPLAVKWLCSVCHTEVHGRLVSTVLKERRQYVP